MRLIATDRVAWFVCLLVTFVSPQKRLNRSRCRLGTDLGDPREPCVRWGRDPSVGRGNLGKLSCPLKYIRSQCCGAALSKVNNGDSGTTVAGCNAQ